MSHCVFERIRPDTWQCRYCGFTEVDCLTAGRIFRNCPKAPSRGLGDTIAKITRRLGIAPCRGCQKRREKLNRLFPYRAD